MTTPTLRDTQFRALPLGKIRPRGWLLEQLATQARGLTGHLDEFWPDVRDSGWIGGDAEGWERGPYWLDGLVPLAFLLQEQRLIRKARRWMDYILAHQQDDGWLGPEFRGTDGKRPRDPWPSYVALKAMVQYFEATGDERIPDAIERFIACLDRQIAAEPLYSWNKFRWQDLLLTVHWLYDRTQASWLLGFAARIQDQGFDWYRHFADLPFKDREDVWRYESHVVNNAMAVKAPAVAWRQASDRLDRGRAARAIAQLDRYHGQATGVFTGDECFAGTMPSQGTELCAVVEYLFSLEVLLEILGEPAFGDRLERIAYNALPATFTPDMWAHQYDQQANQVVCRVAEENVYATNGPDSNLYGLEPNFGCCTANMHQGWPKLASHLWMSTHDDGLVALAYAPCTVEWEIRGVPVTVDVETDYPFRDSVSMTVSCDRPVEFPLYLRIPGWTSDPAVRVAGRAEAGVRPGEYYRINRTWTDRERVSVQFPMHVRSSRRYNGAVSISRGPLVFALKIGEEWRKLRGEEPHADWEVYPTTPWNYAVDVDPDRPGPAVVIAETPMGSPVFSPEGAPIRAAVKARRLPDWELESNAAAPPPTSPAQSSEPLEDVTLIPYGCTNLRVTEFPTLD
jgi:uncharacterized protein